MDGADDLPVLPPSLPPSLPPTVPPSPHPPPGDPVAGAVSPDRADEPLPADLLATRNVPTATGRKIDLGLPDPSGRTSTRPEFVRPELAPMGDATVALLVGRVLLAVAALVIGVAARRATGGRADAFWPVVFSAGVFAMVGVAGLTFWSARFAGNARRLKTRSASARAIAWSWVLVVAFVAFSCLTYLQIDVDGDLDPLPGVAGLGWTIVLAIAYGRLQGVYKALSRTPPVVWLTAFPLDLVAIGLVWWRLTGWPTPIGGQLDEANLTANIAFGASAALLLNALVFARLARLGRNSLRERLGRLEAQHRGPDVATPHGPARGS